MVGVPGFEPGASCAQGKRATKLRHTPLTAVVFAAMSILTDAGDHVKRVELRCGVANALAIGQRKRKLNSIPLPPVSINPKLGRPKDLLVESEPGLKRIRPSRVMFSARCVWPKTTNAA